MWILTLKIGMCLLGGWCVVEEYEFSHEVHCRSELARMERNITVPNDKVVFLRCAPAPGSQ